MNDEMKSCPRGFAGLHSVMYAAAIALCGVHLACADYVKYVSGASTTEGFYGATWNPANLAPSADGVDPSLYDYLVDVTAQFTTKNNEIVDAKSVTIGTVGGNTGYYRFYYAVTFNNEGLVLAKGSIRRRNPDILALNGSVSVVSPSSAPFTISDDNHRDCGIRITGDFSGEETTGLRIALSVGNNNFTLCLSGTADSFLGHIDVDGSKAIEAGSGKHAGLMLEGVSLGASVTVKGGGKFGTSTSAGGSVRELVFENDSVLELSGPLTVGDLTLASGMVIPFKYDSSSRKCSTFLDVTNSFSKTGTSPVVLSLSGTWPSLPSSEPIEVEVLSFPDASGLTLDDFRLEGANPASDASKQVRLMMREDAVTHTKRIVLGFYPLIMFSGWPTDNGTYDNKGSYSSMMTNAAQWTDNLVPHDRAHYGVDRTVNPETGTRGTTYIRTPYCPEGSFALPVESLRLYTSCHLILMSRDFHLRHLDVYNGNQIVCSYDSDVTIHGDVYIGSSTLSIQELNDRMFTLDGNLYGTGLVKIYGRARQANDVRGFFHFTGDNSHYAGKIRATLSVDPGGTYPRWSGNRFTSLYVSDARSLGGPLEEFAYDALTLENMSELITSNSVAFTDASRGLYLKWIAQFTTPGDTTLTLRQPVTFNASAYKNGTGTLEMGGDLKFVDSDGDLTDTPPESATNRTLFVTGGILKPIAARSLDGIDIIFSNRVSQLDVGLAVDIEPSDLDLKTNGLYNVRTSAPMAKWSGMGKIPVYLHSGIVAPSGGYEVAVMTVKEEVADDVFGMFTLVKPETFGAYSVRKRRVDRDEAGTATLFAVLKPSPFFLTIR